MMVGDCPAAVPRSGMLSGVDASALSDTGVIEAMFSSSRYASW